MADLRQVAEYFLEQHGGSIVSLKQSGAPRNIVEEAEKLIAGKQSTTPVGQFLTTINSELTDDEKGALGDFCKTFGTDAATFCRLYKVFRALKS